MSKIYGIHPILCALQKPGLVQGLWLQQSREDERFRELLQLAAAQEITVEKVSRSQLTQLAGSDMHQGVVARCHAADPFSLDDLEARLMQQTHPALLLCLDNLQDPHNLGACIRSANAAACDAVIITRHHTVKVTPTVHKVSAGGAALMNIMTVNRLEKILPHLKTYNVQCIGLAGEAEDTIYDVDLTQPTAIVMGAEGTGLQTAVRAQCDRLVKIPMWGQVASLNVSVATGIVLFETLRQRALNRGSA